MLESNGKFVTVSERRSGEGTNERANGVRMSDAVGTVGGEERARCCGVTLTIGAAACVGKGWERERLAEGWGERFWELESWKYKTGERGVRAIT